jgi:hypothetical protein
VRKPALVAVLVLAAAGCSDRPPPPPPPPTIDFAANAENVTNNTPNNCAGDVPLCNG